jgi:hypothetical protein
MSLPWYILVIEPCKTHQSSTSSNKVTSLLNIIFAADGRHTKRLEGHSLIFHTPTGPVPLWELTAPIASADLNVLHEILEVAIHTLL